MKQGLDCVTSRGQRPTQDSWSSLRIISIRNLASEPKVQNQDSPGTHRDSKPHCLMPGV